MSALPTPRRSLLRRLLRAEPGQPLLTLWLNERAAIPARRVVDCHLRLGRFTLLRWRCVRTDWVAFGGAHSRLEAPPHD